MSGRGMTTPAARVFNWNNLEKDLKVYNVRINQELKSLIIAGDNDVLVGVLEELMEKVNMGQSSRNSKRTFTSATSTAENHPPNGSIPGGISDTSSYNTRGTTPPSSFSKKTPNLYANHISKSLVSTSSQDEDNTTDMEDQWAREQDKENHSFLRRRSQEKESRRFNREYEESLDGLTGMQLLARSLEKVLRYTKEEAMDIVYGDAETVLATNKNASNWVRDLHSDCSTLKRAVANDSEEFIRMLEVLKHGVDSQHHQTSLWTVRLIARLSQGRAGTRETVWQWFIRDCFAGYIVRGINRHGSQIRVSCVPLIANFCRNHYFELFDSELRREIPEASEYLTFVDNILPAMCENSETHRALEQAGIGVALVEYARELATRENSLLSMDSESEKDTNQEVRCAAIKVLSRCWCLLPSQVAEMKDCGEAILEILRKGCRNAPKSVQVTALTCMFNLLEKLVKRRDQFAPQVYKTLVFCLIENHADQEQRDFLMANMSVTLQKLTNLPVQVIIEPLVRSVGMNGYGRDDFNFFTVLANHVRLPLKQALLFIHLLGKIAINDPEFSLVAAQPFLDICRRFGDEHDMGEYLEKYCKVAFSIFMKCSKVISKGNIHNAPDGSEDSHNSKQQLSLEMILGIVDLGNQSLNSRISPLLTIVCREYANLYGDPIYDGLTKIQQSLNSGQPQGRLHSSERLFHKVPKKKHRQKRRRSNKSKLSTRQLIEQNSHRSTTDASLRTDQLPTSNRPGSDDKGDYTSSDNEFEILEPKQRDDYVSDFDSTISHTPSINTMDVRRHLSKVKAESKKAKKFKERTPGKKIERKPERHVITEDASEEESNSAMQRNNYGSPAGSGGGYYMQIERQKEQAQAAIKKISEKRKNDLKAVKKKEQNESERQKRIKRKLEKRRKEQYNEVVKDGYKKREARERAEAKEKRRKRRKARLEKREKRKKAAVTSGQQGGSPKKPQAGKQRRGATIPECPEDVFKLLYKTHRRPLMRIFKMYRGKKPTTVKTRSFDDLAELKKCLSIAEYHSFCEDFGIVPELMNKSICSSIFQKLADQGTAGIRMVNFQQFLKSIWVITAKTFAEMKKEASIKEVGAVLEHMKKVSRNRKIGSSFLWNLKGKGEYNKFHSPRKAGRGKTPGSGQKIDRARLSNAENDREADPGLKNVSGHSSKGTPRKRNSSREDERLALNREIHQNKEEIKQQRHRAELKKKLAKMKELKQKRLEEEKKEKERRIAQQIAEREEYNRQQARKRAIIKKKIELYHKRREAETKAQMQQEVERRRQEEAAKRKKLKLWLKQKRERENLQVQIDLEASEWMSDNEIRDGARTPISSIKEEGRQSQSLYRDNRSIATPSPFPLDEDLMPEKSPSIVVPSGAAKGNEVEIEKKVIATEETNTVIAPEETNRIISPEETNRVVTPEETMEIITPVEIKKVIAPEDTGESHLKKADRVSGKFRVELGLPDVPALDNEKDQNVSSQAQESPPHVEPVAETTPSKAPTVRPIIKEQTQIKNSSEVSPIKFDDDNIAHVDQLPREFSKKPEPDSQEIVTTEKEEKQELVEHMKKPPEGQQEQEDPSDLTDIKRGENLVSQVAVVSQTPREAEPEFPEEVKPEVSERSEKKIKSSSSLKRPQNKAVDIIKTKKSIKEPKIAVVNAEVSEENLNYESQEISHEVTPLPVNAEVEEEEEVKVKKEELVPSEAHPSSSMLNERLLESSDEKGEPVAKNQKIDKLAESNGQVALTPETKESIETEKEPQNESPDCLPVGQPTPNIKPADEANDINKSDPPKLPDKQEPDPNILVTEQAQEILDKTSTNTEPAPGKEEIPQLKEKLPDKPGSVEIPQPAQIEETGRSKTITPVEKSDPEQLEEISRSKTIVDETKKGLPETETTEPQSGETKTTAEIAQVGESENKPTMEESLIAEEGTSETWNLTK